MKDLSKLAKAALALTLAGAALLLGTQVMAADKAAAPTRPAAEKTAPPGKQAAARTIEMSVTEKGYEPASIKVKKGEPVKLLITRKTESTCATEIIIKDSNINVPLPLNKQVAVDWTPA